MAAPRIADVSCQRLRFEPGDRLLVRAACRLSPGEERRLRRAIVKWAGCEVEVLVVDLTRFDVSVEGR